MKHSRKHAADSTFLKGVADQSTVDEPAFFPKITDMSLHY